MIVTQRVDNARTGWNRHESVLTQSNVSSGNFGKLFECTVDGSVYAQPLVVQNVLISGKTMDVVYVATMHNSVFCFPANSPGTEPVWKKNLGPSIQLPNGSIGPSGYKDIVWEVGILSTPVIDTAAKVIYVVNTSQDPAQNNQINYKLWKISLDGTAAQNVEIGASHQSIHFVSNRQNQRPALTLANDNVYIAFASYGDQTDYQGWILGYNATTLAQTWVFTTSPNYRKGTAGAGIWQAGQGLAVDNDGNLFCMTGNGDSPGDYSESVLKINPFTNKVVSSFTPHDKDNLNKFDTDLGSGGLVLLPGTNSVVGGGKASILYLMNQSSLGGFNTTDKVEASLNVSSGDLPGRSHHIHGTPAYYNGPNGPRLYVWTENSFPKAISFNEKPATLSLASIGTLQDPENVPGGSVGMPGGFLSVSSNGNMAGTGILWANHPYAGDANQDIRSGVLRAFDAYDLKRVLWHSYQNPGRDDFGNFAKFCCPTIQGGRVYQATMGGLERKNTTSDATNVPPAFANQNNNRLAVVFRGLDGELNVNISPDGLSWDQKTKVIIPGEKSNLSPGLTFNPDGTTYLAWVGEDNKNSINILQTTSINLSSWGSKRTTSESSKSGVSLAFSQGLLIVAWTGSDAAGSLNIATTTDGGATWKNKVTLQETSQSKPVLAVTNNVVALAWRGQDNSHMVNLMTCTNLSTLQFSNKVEVGAAGANSVFGIDFDAIGVPWLFWAGTDSGNHLNSMTAEGPLITDFTHPGARVRTFQDDSSPSGAAICRFKGRMIGAWEGGDRALNFAVVGRGSVAVYGLFSREVADKVEAG